MKIETDRAQVLSGVRQRGFHRETKAGWMAGMTTGDPLIVRGP